MEKRQGNGRGTPYAVTGWLRRAMTPIVAAAHWEHTHFLDIAAPVTAQDIEAVFLLGVPTLSLSSEARGSCRMTVELSNSSRRTRAGVVIEVEEGRVTSCTTRLDSQSGSQVEGPLSAWLAAAMNRNPSRLQQRGDPVLAGELILALSHFYRPLVNVPVPLKPV